MSEKIDEVAKLWFEKMSQQVNKAVGMLLVHPDQDNAEEVRNTLTNLAFDMDLLLEDYHD